MANCVFIFLRISRHVSRMTKPINAFSTCKISVLQLHLATKFSFTVLHQCLQYVQKFSLSLRHLSWTYFVVVVLVVCLSLRGLSQSQSRVLLVLLSRSLCLQSQSCFSLFPPSLTLKRPTYMALSGVMFFQLHYSCVTQPL